MQYPDFDDAVRLCLKAGKGCAAAKSDMSSAFRHFGIKKKHWKFLVMKAQHPITNKWYYFVDKCMPFGASISCSHFQRFSNAISHIVKYKNEGKDNINYLDDFFFAELLKACCNQQIRNFITICNRIKFPVAMEKTYWGCTRIEFLGLLIDTFLQIVCIPMDKLVKGHQVISNALKKRNITLSNLQKITGFLNFLGKAIVPGRAFTRRLYAYEKQSIKTTSSHQFELGNES